MTNITLNNLHTSQKNHKKREGGGKLPHHFLGFSIFFAKHIGFCSLRRAKPFFVAFREFRSWRLEVRD